MKKETVTIINKTGLHTRPAKDFVQLAKSFESIITIQKDGQEFNGKSLIKIMKAGICKNDEIEIMADGNDEELAIEKLTSFISNLDPNA